ncbi:hypothetical protein [Pseudomonas poae]
MNASTLGVERKEGLTMQQAFNVQIRLFADQFEVEPKRQADKFIPENL